MNFLLLIYIGILTFNNFNGPLEKYEWKNRIIVIFADNPGSEDYLQQVRLLNENCADFRERDLISFHIFRDEAYGPGDQALGMEDRLYLQNQYKYKAGGFAILLIGKDGTVKTRSLKPISASELYTLIDGMPMRKVEMHRKNTGS